MRTTFHSVKTVGESGTLVGIAVLGGSRFYCNPSQEVPCWAISGNVKGQVTRGFKSWCTNDERSLFGLYIVYIFISFRTYDVFFISIAESLANPTLELIVVGNLIT